MNSTHDDFAVKPTDEAGSPLTVACLAHAGGTTARAQRWSRLAPDGVVVAPIELPGHGQRLREEPLGDWDALLACLVGELAERLGAPYALHGHSMGALLALDLAHALEPHLGPPEVLVVSGKGAPSGTASAGLHDLPDEELVARLRNLGGIPDEIAEMPEALELFLPALRTDLRLAETYVAPERGPLGSPVVVFAGADDPLAPPDTMDGWRSETHAPLDVRVRPGGHFFVDEEGFADELWAALRSGTHVGAPA